MVMKRRSKENAQNGGAINNVGLGSGMYWLVAIGMSGSIMAWKKSSVFVFIFDAHQQTIMYRGAKPV